MTYYVLTDDKKVIPAKTMDELARFLQEKKGTNYRIVKKEEVDGKYVSTVFIGINYSGEEPPDVFETMVFSAKENGESLYQSRCATWEEAEEQHKKIVKWVRKKLS